jgi:acetyl esterase/lipase
MSLESGPVDQDFLDRSYNNGAAVPAWSEIFAAMTAASAPLRQRHQATMDLAYGSGERQKVDVFPGPHPDAPCLVFFHGGYWQRNARDMFAVLGQGVAHHGWSVAIPGYTLAPQASLGQIVDETGVALDFLAARRKSLGLNGPLVVSGWSAGGHLAAMALSHPAVAAGLAISGIFELAPLAGTYLNANMAFSQDELARLSPARRPVVNKPLDIAYGGLELPALVAQSEGFHAYRRQSRAPGECFAVAGADHFSVLDALRDPDGALTQALLKLVRV